MWLGGLAAALTELGASQASVAPGASLGKEEVAAEIPASTRICLCAGA